MFIKGYEDCLPILRLRLFVVWILFKTTANMMLQCLKKYGIQTSDRRRSNLSIMHV